MGYDGGDRPQIRECITELSHARKCVKNSLQTRFFCDILRMLQKNTYVHFSEGANPGDPGGLREQTIRKNKTKWRKET